MFEEAATGESTTSNYSSLLGANGVPAAPSNAREDTKEAILNGPSTNGPSMTAPGASAAAPTPNSTGPPTKKQVWTAHFLLNIELTASPVENRRE